MKDYLQLVKGLCYNFYDLNKREGLVVQYLNIIKNQIKGENTKDLIKKFFKKQFS